MCCVALWAGDRLLSKFDAVERGEGAGLFGLIPRYRLLLTAHHSNRRRTRQTHAGGTCVRRVHSFACQFMCCVLCRCFATANTLCATVGRTNMTPLCTARRRRTSIRRYSTPTFGWSKMRPMKTPKVVDWWCTTPNCPPALRRINTMKTEVTSQRMQLTLCLVRLFAAFY